LRQKPFFLGIPGNRKARHSTTMRFGTAADGNIMIGCFAIFLKNRTTLFVGGPLGNA